MGTRTNLTELTSHVLAQPGNGRCIVAIAGAPGSGKSTLAARLVDDLNTAIAGFAALLEMDGYHYDDRVLEQMGCKARKGAPDTFDTGGLTQMLARLRQNSEGNVAVPVFDRSIEIARAAAHLIAKSCKVVVVEGNYLLLDRPPWDGLASYFDVTVLLDTPRDVLRKRLMQRWHRLGLSPAEAHRKVEENDLPNGRFVLENSIEPGFILATSP